MHTLTDSPLNIHGEEVPAIYQAVLFRDLEVITDVRPWQDGGQEVTLSGIKKRLMPGVYAYKHEEGIRWNCLDQAGPELTDAQIEDHFARAKVLDNLLYKALGGRHLGQVPLAEVQAMPFAVFEQAMQQMNKICAPHASRIRPGLDERGASRQ